MYAIVKTGGKQYKVAEGDVIEVEKLAGQPGDSLSLAAVLLVDGEDLITDAAKLASAAVSLPALLLVDGSDITSDADALAKASVSGEVVAHTRGPKIRIHKFKNKTGYHKRQGHRQPLTRVQVIKIAK